MRFLRLNNYQKPQIIPEEQYPVLVDVSFVKEPFNYCDDNEKTTQKVVFSSLLSYASAT